MSHYKDLYRSMFANNPSYHLDEFGTWRNAFGDMPQLTEDQQKQLNAATQQDRTDEEQARYENFVRAYGEEAAKEHFPNGAPNGGAKPDSPFSGVQG